MDIQMEFKLREATEKDLMLIYNWANDPITRANSFSTREISIEEHSKWFKNVLSNNNTFLYVMTCDNKNIGQVRIKVENNSAEISFSIDKSFRGKGYGNRIIELLIEKIRKDFPNIKKLIAEVKPENERSQKVFKKNMFDKKFITYEFEL